MEYIKITAKPTEDSQYHQEKTDNIFALRDEVRALGISADVFKYNDILIVMLDEEEKIIIGKDYKGQYNIFSWKQYPKCDWEDVKRESEKLIKPNNFKKPTVKKIRDWMNYQFEINKLIAKKSTEKGDKIAEFKNKLEEIKNSKNIKKYVIYPDGLSGYIETDTLEYSFEILNNGYIEQKIRLTTYPNNIDTFAELIK